MIVINNDYYRCACERVLGYWSIYKTDLECVRACEQGRKGRWKGIMWSAPNMVNQEINETGQDR